MSAMNAEAGEGKWVFITLAIRSCGHKPASTLLTKQLSLYSLEKDGRFDDLKSDSWTLALFIFCTAVLILLDNQ